jgi:hypothetical protein
MGNPQLRCKYCRREFETTRGVTNHEPQCSKRLPRIYRIALPFARRRIQQLDFDLRTHEGKVFEYAVLRYYVDNLECWSAFVALLGRVYLMFPWDDWTGVALVGAGAMSFTPADPFFLVLACAAIVSRRELIRDYRRHVVDRLDKIARRE